MYPQEKFIQGKITGSILWQAYGEELGQGREKHGYSLLNEDILLAHVFYTQIVDTGSSCSPDYLKNHLLGLSLLGSTCLLPNSRSIVDSIIADPSNTLCSSAIDVYRELLSYLLQNSTCAVEGVMGFVLQKCTSYPSLYCKMRLVKSLLDSNTEVPNIMKELAGDNYPCFDSEFALASAVYLVLKYIHDPMTVIWKAVNIPGCQKYLGKFAGSLIGTIHSYQYLLRNHPVPESERLIGSANELFKKWEPQT